MVSRRTAGFTLLELVVSMFVFGIFLMILIMLTSEMRRYESKLPVNFMKHPQVSAVVSRLRRDVLDAMGDATGNPYVQEWPPTNPQYRNTRQVLIINTWENGPKTVVWDFREPGVVMRRSYNVGIATDWVARGLPEDIGSFDLGAEKIPGRSWAVRITATDKKGRIAIDQIFQPRAHN